MFKLKDTVNKFSFLFIISFWILISSFLTFSVNYVFQISQTSNPKSKIHKNPLIVVGLNYVAMFLLMIPVYLVLWFKSGKTGFAPMNLRLFRIYTLYATISSISDLANLYSLLGISISSYLILINLYIPLSAVFARLICKIRFTGLQWLTLILIIFASVMVQTILEPNSWFEVKLDELPFYAALLTTITLDCINMNLLTRELTRKDGDTVTSSSSESFVSLMYSLFVIYSFCIISTLCLLFLSTFIFFPDEYYNQKIYLYCFLYALNTLVYVWVCRKYDPVIFTLSGTLSVFWTAVFNPEIFTVQVVLGCCVLTGIVGIYILLRQSTQTSNK